MKLKVNDQLVIEHVKMMQDIIVRLANNSKQCKQWCIALVTAILAYATKENAAYTLSYIPICLFYFLDSYYLSLERKMRNSESDFLWDVENGKDIDEKLFLRGKVPVDWATEFCEMIPHSFNKILSTIKAALSLSTFPFYVILIVFVKIVSVQK